VTASTISNGSYARTESGKIDFSAYVGKTGAIDAGGLTVAVKITDARTRYGHLDLYVTPVTGYGDRWVEYKNISIDNDPGFIGAAAPAGTPALTVVPAEVPNDSTVAETPATQDVLAQVRALLAKTTIK
jgi:hypothetical protein